MQKVPWRPVLDRRVQHFLDLIYVATEKDLKVRYKSSFLGYLWSIAHPLSLALVFYFAFKMIMKIKLEAYALFLITGLFPWQWLSNSVTYSTGVFLSNSSLIKKVNFPRSVLVFALVLQDMIHFAFAVPVIVLFKFVYGHPFHISWLYGLPLLLIVQFGLAFGIALMLASANLFFRDLERLTVILMTLLFYMTPVFYPEHLVPSHYRPFIVLNPMAPLIISWRNVLFTGNVNVTYLLASVGYSALAVLVGHKTYKRLSWKFAEVL